MRTLSFNVRALWLVVGLSSTLLPVNLGAQGRGGASVGTTFYAVSYVEVMATPAARAAAAAAFGRYRDAVRSQTGFVSAEAFEQVGRPGHYSLIETWRDQMAFDARPTAAQMALAAALQPVRVSDYDQRPYKTLTVVGPPSTKAPASAVSVIAHVDVNQDPKVPAMLTRLAETSRQEPGNLRFDVMQHTMRANHFTVIETWRDQKAFDAHVAAAHTKQYRDEVQPMTGSPLDERTFKAVE